MYEMSENTEEKAAEISKRQAAFKSDGTWTAFVANLFKYCATLFPAIYTATMKKNRRGGNPVFKTIGESRAFK